MWTIGAKVAFIEKCFGKAYISSTEKNIEVCCPYCDPKDRTKKKLAIRIADDANHCWRCGAKSRSLYFLLRKFKPECLQEYVDTFMPSMKNYALNGNVQNVEAEKFSLPNDFTLLPLASQNDPEVKLLLNYLNARGVNERDIWFHKIGISSNPKWFRRVLFPSFDRQGEPNFLVARAADKRLPKYQTPAITRTSIVFNEINVDWKKRVIICEGVFDALKCGENAVPLLGSSLNETSLLFERIVSNNTPVVVVLDSDMIDTATPRIVNKLKEYAVDAKFATIGSKDPGEMAKEDVAEAVENAKDLDWFSFIMTKLNRSMALKL